MFGILASVWQRLGAPPAKPHEHSIGPYHVFTRDFDRIVEADEIDTVLGPLSRTDQEALDAAWSSYHGALQGWRTKLHLQALDASSRIRAKQEDTERADIIVSLLIDHSGSMRGQSILLAAASADVAQDFLRHLDIDVEVLGFTTVGWQGGRSRRRWLRSGRPRAPGRLCDLLHIVYQSGGAAESKARAGWYWKPMLRPDLLKENVDGEALEWAATRLRESGRKRKLLLVISDGAPVDDATLSANGLDFLDRHLKSVVRELEAGSEIDVAGIGIGFEVSRYYSTSSTVKITEDLGTTLIGMLERLIVGERAEA